MKINYFSPLSPTRSGIAEVSGLIIPALSQYAEVTVWTDQEVWDQDLENYSNIRYYNPYEIDWRDINESDINICHIGNNINYHHSILMISQQCPSIVILHDIKLCDIFRAFYSIHHDLNGTSIDNLKAYHGSAIETQSREFWMRKVAAKTDKNFAITEWAMDNAAAVIVHNRGAFEELSQHQRWLIGYQALPYHSTPLFIESQAKFVPPYRLIVFGHIGYNRRVESVLKAIDEMPNKNQFQLNIYGGIDDEQTLREKIGEHDLRSNVKLHGFVADDVLDLALSNAHLAINLRYPTMGEASLSQLRIWRHALPSIVTQMGWYSEQSEDAVLFVDQEHEIEDIKRHLQRLVDDPESLIAMGKRGQQILQADHSPDAYARALIELGKELPIGYQALTAQYLVRRVGREMACWQMPELGKQELSSVAAAMHFLSQ